MNNKKIVYSILITTILVLSVYFVNSGIVEGNGKETFYNVTDNTGAVEGVSKVWNPVTNYTKMNNSYLFNFSINMSSTTAFNGNVSNITITFPNFIFVNVTDESTKNGTSSNFMDFIVIDALTVRWYNKTTTAGGLTNGTSTAFNNGTFWVNITTNSSAPAGDGIETTGNITINASNATGTASSYLTFTIGVDGKAPRITNITATADGTITSASDNIYLNGVDDNITINAYITDANLNTSNVTLWWNRSDSAARVQINPNTPNITMTLTQVSGSTNTWIATATLNKSFINDQHISFIIQATDYFSQTNNATNSLKGYNITIDNVVPNNPVINIPNERIITQRAYPITCSGEYRTLLTDVTNGATICDSILGLCEDWVSSNKGIIQLQCINYDEAGNSKTITQDITVYSSSTSGTSTTSTESNTGVTNPIVDVNTPQNVLTSAGQTQTFTYGATEHILKVDKVTEDSATVTIDGKMSLTIPSTESREVDLDGDGTKDVKVTLNAIRLNKADITIEKLVGATSDISEQVTKQKSSLAWLWWLLGIAIIGGIAYYFVVMNKKKK